MANKVPAKKLKLKQTYKKGTPFPKTEMATLLNVVGNSTTNIFMVDSGEYDNGESFLTIKIDYK